MLTVLTSVFGVLVFVGGLVWTVLQWTAKPASRQIIRTLDQLTPGDLEKYLSPMETPSRLEALQHVDSLMVYFEKTKNASGQSAIASVVAAVFSQGDSK